MPRLVDFDIGVTGPPDASSRFLRGRTRPFVEAIYWSLKAAPVDAPFRKLVVALRPDGLGYNRDVTIALNVCEVFVPTEPTMAENQGTVRAWARDTTLGAVDTLSREQIWGSPQFRQIVEGVGRVTGAYVFEQKRLSLPDRRNSPSFTTVFEFDEESFRVRLDERSNLGDTRASWLVAVLPPTIGYEFGFEARAVKLRGHAFEYFDRRGGVLASVAI